MMRSIWKHTKNNQTLYDSQYNDESPVSEFWNHKRSNLPYGLLPLKQLPRWQSTSSIKVLRQKKIPLVLFEDWKVWRQFQRVNLLKSLNIAKGLIFTERLYYKKKRSFRWNCKINRKLFSINLLQWANL